MIKLALETLFSQALVYDRNPHDPREISADRKPLKFTHCLVDEDGAEMLYNEKTGTLHCELLRSDIDPRYPELSHSFSVVPVVRGNVLARGLHGWLFNQGARAFRLDYSVPRVQFYFNDLLEEIKKDRSMVEGVKLIVRAGEKAEQVFYVYENYEVREVLYNPVTDEFAPNMEGEAVVFAGPDAEQNYTRFAQKLSKGRLNFYGRDTFAPQVASADTADYIIRPNDGKSANPSASNPFPHLADATKAPTDQS